MVWREEVENWDESRFQLMANDGNTCSFFSFVEIILPGKDLVFWVSCQKLLLITSSTILHEKQRISRNLSLIFIFHTKNSAQVHFIYSSHAALYLQNGCQGQNINYEMNSSTKMTIVRRKCGNVEMDAKSSINSPADKRAATTLFTWMKNVKDAIVVLNKLQPLFHMRHISGSFWWLRGPVVICWHTFKRILWKWQHAISKVCMSPGSNA